MRNYWFLVLVVYNQQEAKNYVYWVTQSSGQIFHMDRGQIKTGVPLGSILGPLLFFIHINDPPTAISSFAETILFAEDGGIFVNSKENWLVKAVNKQCYTEFNTILGNDNWIIIWNARDS